VHKGAVGPGLCAPVGRVDATRMDRCRGAASTPTLCTGWSRRWDPGGWTVHKGAAGARLCARAGRAGGIWVAGRCTECGVNLDLGHGWRSTGVGWEYGLRGG
jgi:hypothetical protein